MCKKSKFLGAFIFITLLLPLTLSAQSQNLVLNAGFEEQLNPLKKAWFDDKTAFGKVVKNWNCLSYGHDCSLFSTRYQPSNDEVRTGYSFAKCKPYSGSSMLQIWVLPKGGKCEIGGGGYIQTELLQPIKPRKIYSVSFWVHVLKSDGTFLYPDFLKNFGIAFSDHAIRLSDPDCALMSDSPFVIDSSVVGQWYKVNYFIRPTRPLTHLVIGSLYNVFQPYSFPEEQRNQGVNFYFFVDEIDVHEVSNPDSAIEQKAIDYPFLGKPNLRAAQRDLPSSPFADNIYFESDSDVLSDSAYRTLDSLAQRMRLEKNSVYILSGHTDNVGSNHLELSKRRSEAVANYLTIKHKIPKIRLQLAYFGQDSAVADNKSETGRRLNRRVEIRPSANNLTYYLYRMASDAVVREKTDSAFYYLRAWLNQESNYKMLILFDPDLNNLHQHPAWKNIEKEIQKKYEKYRNPALAFQLDQLYFKDQLYRSVGALLLDAKGYIPAGIDTIDFINNASLLRTADSLNLIETIQLIEKLPALPGAVSVGPKAAKAIPYVILHCSDYNVMKKYLPLVESGCKNGEIGWDLYAALFDRIQVHDTGTQRYGSQFQEDPNAPGWFRRVPVENPDQLDEIRASIGLAPIDLNFKFTTNQAKK